MFEQDFFQQKSHSFPVEGQKFGKTQQSSPGQLIFLLDIYYNFLFKITYYSVFVDSR